MFTLKNVRYKSVLQIDALDLHAGKITCLVGPSGGGKTTLLKLLNKMLSPDQGMITYEGEDLKTIDSVHHRRRVVLLSQSPFIFPGTIKDNLLKGLTYREQTKDDEALLHALKHVSLAQALNDDAQMLSGGEKQRLALARVMLLDAACILLDEPSSALDEATEARIVKDVVEYVQKNDKTLIMVTHAKSIAKNIGDYICTIEGGRLKGCELA